MSCKYGDVTKWHRKIFVTADDGEEREYQLPRGAHVNVQEGRARAAGEPLMDGPIDPHDILQVQGETELQRYLVRRDPGGLPPAGRRTSTTSTSR